jgi:hypothetical protein
MWRNRAKQSCNLVSPRAIIAVSVDAAATARQTLVAGDLGNIISAIYFATPGGLFLGPAGLYLWPSPVRLLRFLFAFVSPRSNVRPRTIAMISLIFHSGAVRSESWE